MIEKQSTEPTDCGVVTIKRSTEKALLVDIGSTDVWIPKSQICDDSEIDGFSEDGETGELVLPEWLAIEKGLV